MRVLFIVFIVVMFANPVFSQNALSVVGNEVSSPVEAPADDMQKVMPEKTVKEDDLSPLFSEDSIGSMRKYIETERKKQNDIELLNLDIKKNELELKRKKIQSEIEGLNKTTEGVSSRQQNALSPLENAVESPVLKVLYVALSGSHKESILVINGITYMVREGEIVNGYEVNQIHSQGVTLKGPQGEAIEVSMNFLGK